MTETPDPIRVGDLLRDPAAVVGQVGDNREQAVQRADLEDEVADLDERMTDAVRSDALGYELDPSKVTELQRAHLEARSDRHTANNTSDK